MTAIQVRKTAEEPGSASLAVTVPVAEVREAEERATTSYQQRARLPGFRRGKAPPALVRKHFAEDIRQETLQQLIRASWKVALEQETLQPVADPHIHNLKWEGGGTPVTFEFHVEVKPDVKLERIGKFHLKRKVVPVTDEQVVAQLNELRAQKAPWTPVAGEKPKPKDLVHVTIPARRAVRVDLEQDAVREADAKLRADLIEQIIQANRVVAPRPLVERALWAYAQGYGIPQDRVNQFAQEFRPVAEAQVRRDLVLDWVVEHHALRATAAELDQRLQELADRRGVPGGAAELRASLEKAKRLRDVERSLTEEKVFTFLLSQSTVEPA